jgi:flagellar protein FliO/FliZ
MRHAHRATCAAAWLAVLMTPVMAGAAQKTTTTVAKTAAAPVSASERQDLPPAGGGGGTDVASGMGGTLLRLGLGLLVVVGLIVGVYLLLKRMQRGRMPGFSGAADDLVDVVSTTPLGPNRFLHLIRVGEELILVGATDHSVTPVARIGGEEAVGMLGESADVQDATEAFRTAQTRTGTDPRVQAAATAAQASLVERLRALTTRR